MTKRDLKIDGNHEFQSFIKDSKFTQMTIQSVFGIEPNEMNSCVRICLRYRVSQNVHILRKKENSRYVNESNANDINLLNLQNI